MEKMEQTVWQPISKLAVLADMIDSKVDSRLHDAEEKYNLLYEAVENSMALDNDTVTQAISAYSEELANVELFLEQLNRWRNECQLPAEMDEIIRLTGHLDIIQKILVDILALCNKLQCKDAIE